MFTHYFQPILLLLIANVFMTCAWYGHLKLREIGVFTENTPIIVLILVSWGLAFMEYCFMVPANRMGFAGNGGAYSLIQLKIIQEVITLVVFMLFATLLFKGEALHWNHFVAFVLLIGAVYFCFLK